MRYIFGVDGKAVPDVAHLLHEGNYVCSSSAAYKKLDYLKLAQELDQTHQWNRIKRETYYFGKLLHVHDHVKGYLSAIVHVRKLYVHMNYV